VEKASPMTQSAKRGTRNNLQAAQNNAQSLQSANRETKNEIH